MNQSENLPWTDVYNAVLSDASRFVNLSDGLAGEASVSTFPDGYLTMWDLSGYTKLVAGLDKERQVILSEAIFHAALYFGHRMNSVLVQPPPGDLGAYFSHGEPETLPMDDLLELIENHADLPRHTLSAKAVVVPFDKNSLYLGTFLSPERCGEQTGYTALMGPAYTRALAQLKRNRKDEVVTTAKPKPFYGTPFREINLEKTTSNKRYVQKAVDVLSRPRVPEGPYEHAVLWAKDPHGRTNLVDPMVSASLATSFLANRKCWHPVKQDEGQLHIVSRSEPEDARMSLDGVLHSIKQEMAYPGAEIQFASARIVDSVRLRVRGHVDFAGSDVIRLVHDLKGKNPEI